MRRIRVGLSPSERPLSASVRLASQAQSPRTHGMRRVTERTQATTSMSGAGFGGQDAASATSNSTAGRRIPQPPHAGIDRALAGDSINLIHPYIAAQQIDPWKSVRQEITPCSVWSVALNLGVSARRARRAPRPRRRARTSHPRPAAPYRPPQSPPRTAASTPPRTRESRTYDEKSRKLRHISDLGAGRR
jgi:hypothetical protein